MAARLGDILIKKGFITPEQLQVVLKDSPRSEELMGRALVNWGFC